MKALLLTEPQRLEIADFPDPEVGPDNVLVRVAACGICGSDVHGFDGSSGRRIPPLIMGHEAAGVVVAVGSEVTKFQPGDHVTFDSTIYCGECYYCKRGQMNLCDNRNVLGVSCGEYRRHGAFAELVAVPERVCYSLPASLSFEHASMIEAVSVAVHAVSRRPTSPDETVLVIGCGMIGLLVIQAVRVAGCKRVIAVDRDRGRLETAVNLGADMTVDPNSEDVLKRVTELTDGRGTDVCFEVVGSNDTVGLAIRCTRKGGSVILIGNLSQQAELPLQDVVTRQLSLLGSCASSGEYPRCIELMANGAIQVEPLITAIAPLEQGAEWFGRLYKGEADAMKVILTPNQS